MKARACVYSGRLDSEQTVIGRLRVILGEVSSGWNCISIG